VVANFLLHWFPAKAFKASLDWTYSFWLGTITSALFLLLILSGLPLLFLYVPVGGARLRVVKDIEYVDHVRIVDPLGASPVRAPHGGGGLPAPRARLPHRRLQERDGRGQRRQWNWVIGVGMLLATLFLSFTGYLLPWDQLAYWAVTVGTNIASSIPYVGPAVRELMIGGRTIDQPTLIRFYVLHIVLLPGLLAALFVYHMWRVRKDGGSPGPTVRPSCARRVEEPPARTKTYTLLGVRAGTAPTIRSTTLEAPHLTVNAVPDLVRRAATAVLGTIAAISILSTLVRSPLEEAANALVTPNPAKAPWYFLWLQEIVTDTTFHIGSFTVNGAFFGG
jgi:quinol-cytochrome oxidoreductase complex cytochrome b subunit